MAPEKLQVLHALDVAATQRYHVRAVVISGMGFFADAYNLFCITLVTKLLGRIYYHDPERGEPGRLPPRLDAAINGVTFCGMIVGQLFFGWLGDKVDRKKFYGKTIMLMIMGSFLSGLSFGNTADGVMATLCFFRFWLGVGFGGDYPLSATIMSEYANKKTRGSFTYHWRMKMPETARYTALVARDADRAARDMSRVLSVDIAGEPDKVESLTRGRDYGVFSRRFCCL